MKKTLLLLAGLIMVAGSSAQFKWGIKTGLNFSNLNESPYVMLKTGMYAGFVGEYRLAGWFALQPELLYSMQGGSDVQKKDDLTMRYRIRANYVIVPVMAKFYLFKNLSIDIGPQAGYVIQGRHFHKIINHTVNREVSKYKLPVSTSEYNAFDFSAAAGISYKLISGVGVSVRYSYGFTDFLQAGKWKNGVVQVGLMFGI